MRVNSNYSTPNFQARIKLNSPNLQKLKNETVLLKDMPEIKKTVASGVFSLGGTATFVSGNYAPSVQAVPVLKEGLPLLGTTVANFPMSAGIVAEANKDSGTNSSVPLEIFLFHNGTKDNKKLPS